MIRPHENRHLPSNVQQECSASGIFYLEPIPKVEKAATRGRCKLGGNPGAGKLYLTIAWTLRNPNVKNKNKIKANQLYQTKPKGDHKGKQYLGENVGVARATMQRRLAAPLLPST